MALCWELNWADRIPEPYRDRYGLEALRDTVIPEVDEPLRERMWHFAEDTVKEVEQQVFPIHRLV